MDTDAGMQIQTNWDLYREHTLARHKEENLIYFDNLETIGAHAKISNSEYKYIAVDANMHIYGYNMKPTITFQKIVPEHGVWQYDVNDQAENAKSLGIYTGNIPWDKTLLKIR